MLPFPTQLDVRLADRDARWHCERFFTLTLAGGQVDMFFIDTSPGVASYRTAPWAANPGVFLCHPCLFRLLRFTYPIKA